MERRMREEKRDLLAEAAFYTAALRVFLLAEDPRAVNESFAIFTVVVERDNKIKIH